MFSFVALRPALGYTVRMSRTEILAQPMASIDSPASRSRWSIIVPLACILFTLSMALFSTGFLEADEITHFLYARAIWHDPYALVSIWGRMGASAFFGLAAPFGFTAARLLAVIVTILTAYGTALLLRHFTKNPNPNPNPILNPIPIPTPILNPNPAPNLNLVIPPWLRRHTTAIAWLLFFAQPCVLLNSFTVMTEMLLACAWVWAAVVLVKFDSRRGLIFAGLILGLGGIMRPEGWLAIAAWPLFAAAWRSRPDTTLRRELPAIALSTFFAGFWPLLWYLLGAWVWHDGLWVLRAWPWAASSPYGRTAGLFLLSSLVAPAVWMWIPIVIAMWACWRARWRQALLILVAPVTALFLAHGLLGSLGLFGSLSLPRYFQAVAPMLAVLAALGIGRLSPTPQALRWVIPLAMLPCVVLASLRLLPMQAVTEQKKLDIIVQAVQSRQPAADMLLVRHPYPLMRLGLDLNSPAQTRVLDPKEIQNAPPGTLLIVDSTVWDYENCPKPEMLKQWGYVIDKESAEKVDAIPPRFEPLNFHVNPDARVRLWIKR